MKSVIYVTTTFPTLAAFIENEVHRLHARGVRVEVLTLRGVGREYQPEHAALVPLTRPVGSLRDLSGWWALVRWSLRRPWVLISGMARMAWASRRSVYALAGHLAYLPAAARVADVAERGGFERVHGAWAHFPASVAWLAARLSGRRFSMAAHAGADLYRTQAFLAEKVRDADFVTACVRGNAEMLQALAGTGRGRIVHLYHGTDLARFGAVVRRPDVEPLLLTVGRLAPAKGFDDAIAALGHLGARGIRPRLVLVGDGPERARLESLAQAAGVRSQVEFTGSLTHDAIAAWYARAWALLAPSKVLANGRRDGIPNVVVEAMAAGVAVVGTRAAGLEEAVTDGVTGMLAAPGDPAALAQAVEPLLRDPVLARRLGDAGRGRVLDTFDAEKNFERLHRLFLSHGAGSSPCA